MTDEKNNIGNHNTGYRNIGNYNTGYRNTGDHNTGDHNIGNHNTGYRNIGNHNTGYRNTGNYNTGDRNTGDRNTGDRNTGDRNTGDFNTTTPDTVNFFNKPYSLKEWNNIIKPDWVYLPSPTTWVSDGDMTSVEKTDNPTFHICGGYLRINDMHEEWRKAMSSATYEEIQQVRDLPNFDYDVFEEITGLDLRVKSDTCDGKVVVVDGVEYTLQRK